MQTALDTPPPQDEPLGRILLVADGDADAWRRSLEGAGFEVLRPTPSAAPHPAEACDLLLIEDTLPPARVQRLRETYPGVPVVAFGDGLAAVEEWLPLQAVTSGSLSRTLTRTIELAALRKREAVDGGALLAQLREMTQRVQARERQLEVLRRSARRSWQGQEAKPPAAPDHAGEVRALQQALAARERQLDALRGSLRERWQPPSQPPETDEREQLRQRVAARERQLEALRQGARGRWQDGEKLRREVGALSAELERTRAERDAAAAALEESRERLEQGAAECRRLEQEADAARAQAAEKTRMLERIAARLRRLRELGILPKSVVGRADS